MLGRVDPVLAQAMAPVLHDLHSTGVAAPRVDDSRYDRDADPESILAMMWSADGSGAGVRVDRSWPDFAQVASVAEQVQEWAFDELWGTAASNWPQCPQHPNNHPMKASIQDSVAVWVCPVDDMAFCNIGSLSRL
jgi:hypothetical protein